jgi:hypothetical protein
LARASIAAMSRKAGQVRPCKRDVSLCGGWAGTVECICVTMRRYKEFAGGSLP